jgi:hypothetical protein
MTGLADGNPSSRTNVILTDDQARRAAFTARDSLSYMPRAGATAALLASHEEQARRIKALEEILKEGLSFGYIRGGYGGDLGTRARAALAGDTEQDETP